MKAAAVIAAILLWPAGVAVAANTFQCESPYILDGDTLQCGQVRVRLAGIDAPELDGHCKAGRKCTEGDAAAARLALVQLTRSTVACTAIEIDRYGRTIASCTALGVDLSCAMIANGHAVARYRPIDCPPAAD